MFMRPTIFLLATSLFLGMMTQTSITSAEIYELRIYTTHKGKLDDLNARFRDHTVGLFKKHGMENVGYWVPTDAARSENTLIYVLRHKDREAARQSWKAFLSDPEWQKVAKESQQDGPILSERPQSIFMNLTDYSPKPAGEKEKTDGGVFELRIYKCHPGKGKNLDARFRDHTMRIFKRHGMESVAYWHPAEDSDGKDTLVYILRHDSSDAASESWQAFRGDEEWKKVAEESQKDGKILSGRPDSVYMKPTDYSPIQ